MTLYIDGDAFPNLLKPVLLRAVKTNTSHASVFPLEPIKSPPVNANRIRPPRRLPMGMPSLALRTRHVCHYETASRDERPRYPL